jgi:hypothetical protein
VHLNTLQHRKSSQIFRTDAVKIIKLNRSLIGRHHPRSSALPHTDTGPSISSIFGTLPGSPFLSVSSSLSAIRPGSPQWYQNGVLTASISFLETGKITGCQSKRVLYLRDDRHFVFRQRMVGEDESVRRGVMILKQLGLLSPNFGATYLKAFTQSP